MKPFKLGLFLPTFNRDYNSVSSSYWIRVYEMVNAYERLNLKVYVNDFLKRYDAAIFFRSPNRKYYYLISWIRFISKKFYLDLNVNYFEKHAHTNKDQINITRKIASLSNGIICTTDPIAESARKVTSNVFVMDDPINTDYFNLRKKNITFSDPVFGWSGISKKSKILNKYATRITNKIILITDIGIMDQELKFDFDFVEWRYEKFPQDLLNCDVGFLPRTVDDPYNNGHSSFKALVFAVQGIPIIANKLPSYVKLAKYYGGIVFLEDFSDNINSCIRELETRSLDTSTVKSYYSCNNQAQRLKDFLKGS